MMPKLVCSLIRHNQKKNSDTPRCVELFNENRDLKQQIVKLLNSMESLKRENQELRTRKPWWKWW
jgi:hypothetical protein